MNGINRILNIPLNLGIGRQSKTTDRESQQGGGYSRQKQERNPSEDEAKKAFEILLNMESIKKNALTVELKADTSTPNGTPVYILIVRDQSGAQLRGLRGLDILKILEQGDDSTEKKETGRILDRRI